MNTNLVGNFNVSNIGAGASFASAYAASAHAAPAPKYSRLRAPAGTLTAALRNASAQTP